MGASEALSNVKDTAKKTLGATGAVVVGIFLLAVLLGVPIAMIVIGVQNENKCPVEPWIPTYLTVAGATSVGIILAIVVASLCGMCEMTGCVGFFSLLAGLASLFSFGWFIAGNVWVFKNYENRALCDPTTYQFAFWIIIITYIWCVISCCCGPAARSKS